MDNHRADGHGGRGTVSINCAGFYCPLALATCPLSRNQRFVDAHDFELSSIVPKNCAAAGTGGQDTGNSMLVQPVSKLVKHPVKTLGQPQVAGDLAATIKHQADGRIIVSQRSIQSTHGSGPGAGQGTTRKEDGTAAGWNQIPSKQGVTAQLFIVQPRGIWFEVHEMSNLGLLSHSMQHGRRRQPFRTDRIA